MLSQYCLAYLNGSLGKFAILSKDKICFSNLFKKGESCLSISLASTKTMHLKLS